MTKTIVSKTLTEQFLIEQYIKKLKNPNEIAEMLGYNHKTVRSYLKKFNIKLRSPSEFNSLSHKTYTEPSAALLLSPLSFILHSIYKCEGDNGTATTFLRFVNQDLQLIITFCNAIKKIYQYESTIQFEILYNFNCLKSIETTLFYEKILKNYPDSITTRHFTPNNKNPLIRVAVGGRRLFEIFSKNMNYILKNYELNN